MLKHEKKSSIFPSFPLVQNNEGELVLGCIGPTKMKDGYYQQTIDKHLTRNLIKLEIVFLFNETKIGLKSQDN